MRSRLIPAIALTVLAAGMSSQARADIGWTLKNVTFSDGGTAYGSFLLDVYGYTSGGLVTTTAGSTLNGFTYDAVGVNVPFGNILIATPVGAYTQTFVLTFQYDLGTAIAFNPIVSGYECIGFSCDGTSAQSRLVTGGFAAAPEASTWAMMIVGAGFLGLAETWRRGRARTVAA